MKIKNITHAVKRQTQSFAIRLKSTIMPVREVLADNKGLTALEIALGAIVSIVLCGLILNAFTGVFNNSVLPKVKDTIMGMFG